MFHSLARSLTFMSVYVIAVPVDKYSRTNVADANKLTFGLKTVNSKNTARVN